MARPDNEPVDQTGRFLALLRSDLIAAAGATVALAAIAVGFRAWPLLWLCAVGGSSALVRFGGASAARRGDLTTAVVLYAGGFWAWSLFAVALVPIGMPVFLFNVLVPVIVAATYLEERHHRRLALCAVAVVAAFALLGTMQEGLRIQDRGPDWAVNATIAGFLVSHTWMFTAAIRDANRTRVATLDAAIERADRLRDSESALRASRRRLVEVADAERGRIERDIHDGAQQRLVSLAVRLKLAIQLTESAPITPEQLEQMHGEAAAALQELRDLAAGIYPPLLVESGLASALAALCRRVGPAVDWHGEEVDDVPEAIAVDLYFIANEAIQNALKHGGPVADRQIDVKLSKTGDSLVLSVTDNGPGFDPASTRHARGLLNMEDRAASLDGSLRVSSSPGAGTTVHAEVPLAEWGGEAVVEAGVPIA